MIGTARPELLDRRPAWGGGRRNASLVWLDALSPVESAAMLDELLPGDLSAETRERARRARGGQPVLPRGAARGAIVETGTVVEELPDSVQAILAARVDRLAARRQGGAPGGVRDRPDLLERADARARRRRAGRLGGARGPGLHPPPPGLVASAARRSTRSSTRSRARSSTRSVPKARRARLHAAFAAWLERTGGGRDEDAALLAHHYAQAASPEDADLAWADAADELERLRRARSAGSAAPAELAIRRYDLDEGIADLQRALELCEPHERSELWREIGRASALKFDGQRFWEAMKRALS